MTAVPRAQWACYKPLKQLLRVQKYSQSGPKSDCALRALPLFCRTFSEQVYNAHLIGHIMEAGAPRRHVLHAQRNRMSLCSPR